MGFTVRKTPKEIARPAAVCDLCGELIQFSGVYEDNNWWTGNAEWAVDYRTDERSSDVFLAHKGCTDRLEAKHRKHNETWRTMELPDYIVWLLHSMNFGPEAVAEEFERTGLPEVAEDSDYDEGGDFQ